jgi:hypothetical protein
MGFGFFLSSGFFRRMVYTTTQHTTTQPTNQPTTNNNKNLDGPAENHRPQIHATTTPAGWLGEEKKYARLVTIQQQPFMGWMVRHTHPIQPLGRKKHDCNSSSHHHDIHSQICLLFEWIGFWFWFWSSKRRKSIKKKA